MRGDAALHVLVDGLPLIPRLFDSDGVLPPDMVLHNEDGLRAGVEPREHRIAEATCTEGCCGALMTRIVRDEENGLVTWELRRTRGKDSQLEVLTFDADAYATEVARAEADWSWEWPARRAARFLRARLEAEPEVLARWDCRFYWAGSWNSDRDQLHVVFNYPADAEMKYGETWLQFKYSTYVPDAVATDDAAARAKADQVVEQLNAGDPKAAAQVCGGSRKSAKALGYPWPW